LPVCSGGRCRVTPIVVYLNLSESDMPREWYDWARLAVEAWLVAFGPCEVVLDRPDEWPGSYVEVRYGPPLGWAALGFPSGTQIAAIYAGRALQPSLDRWDQNVIWIDQRRVRPHPAVLTAQIVHEFGHCLGWAVREDGTHWPPEQTAEWWVLTKANHPIAAANLARYKRAVREET
jgi:hypothetical protein